MIKNAFCIPCIDSLKRDKDTLRMALSSMTGVEAISLSSRVDVLWQSLAASKSHHNPKFQGLDFLNLPNHLQVLATHSPPHPLICDYAYYLVND